MKKEMLSKHKIINDTYSIRRSGPRSAAGGSPMNNEHRRLHANVGGFFSD
jgi:hypothetical protein